jgi:hypothetical protein
MDRYTGRYSTHLIRELGCWRLLSRASCTTRQEMDRYTGRYSTHLIRELGCWRLLSRASCTVRQEMDKYTLSFTRQPDLLTKAPR